MADFEKIILRCIIHYNTKRIIEDFPYTEEMITEKIRPFSNCIWNYSLQQSRASLISMDNQTLIMTLLPRTEGRFTRKGLVVNRLRYRNDRYTERYLSGGAAIAAYNPEDVSYVWLLDDGKYVRFSLINSRFQDHTLSEVSEMQARQRELEIADKSAVLQAKIDLMSHISVIGENAANHKGTNIKGIRQNRKQEQRKAHMDYVREVTENE